MSSRTIVYAAFDRYPAPKGAATHIRAFVSALAAEFTPIDLVTVAGPAETAAPEANGSVTRQTGESPIPGVRHTQLPAWGATLVERVLSFRTHLRAWWNDQRPRVAHIRSI